MCMLLGLLAVVAFKSRKMPTVDWIRGRIVIILNRTTYALCKSYMHYMCISKSCVKQCLKALIFMLMTKLAFTKSAFEQVWEQL